MKQVIQSGATVEKAITAALEQLQVARDEVTVRVIREEKKGFLGFGAKPAEVEVTVVEKTPEPVPEPEEEPAPEEQEAAVPEKSSDHAVTQAESYLRRVVEELGITDLQVHTKRNGKHVTLTLESDKAALLIGKRGQTLNALQQLTQLAANRFSDQFLTIRLDAENYRERRRETLEQLADRMADKAIQTGEKVQLEPMPSYERKVIHHALSRRTDIETHSEGKEPNRYLVIEPLK